MAFTTAVSAASYPSGDKRTILAGHSTTVTSTSAAVYFPVIGGSGQVASTSEGTIASMMLLPGIVGNLKCQFTTIAGVVTACGGTSIVITLDKNEVATAITCTCLTAATGCVDATDQIYVTAGDQLSFSSTPAGTPTALIPQCTLELDL